MHNRLQHQLNNISSLTDKIISSQQDANVLRKVIYASELSSNEIDKAIKQAVVELAYHGDEKGVEMLVNSFAANIDDAVYGYTLGGHDELIEKLSRNHMAINENMLVLAHAQRGRFDKVDELLSLGVDANYAIEGYRIGGYTVHADQLEQALNQASVNEELDFVMRMLKVLHTLSNEQYDYSYERKEKLSQLVIELLGTMQMNESRRLEFQSIPYAELLFAAEKNMQRYHLNVEYGFKFSILKQGIALAFRLGTPEKKLLDVADQLTEEKLVQIGAEYGLSGQDVQALVPALEMKLISSKTKFLLSSFKAGFFDTPDEMRQSLGDILDENTSLPMLH